MIIGVPKELVSETRVGITPAGAKALTEAGHQVLVEQNAGPPLQLFPTTTTRPWAPRSSATPPTSGAPPR